MHRRTVRLSAIALALLLTMLSLSAAFAASEAAEAASKSRAVTSVPTVVPPAPTPTPVVEFFPGYNDNRINWREVYAPVVYYAVDAGNGAYVFHAYRTGPNGGTLILEVTAQQIATVPANPAQQTLLGASADGYARLYRMPDSSFLAVSGPDAEGKTTYVRFDRMCPGRTCAQYSTWQTP